MTKLRNVRRRRRIRYVQHMRNHGSYPQWHLLCAGRRTFVRWCYDPWVF